MILPSIDLSEGHAVQLIGGRDKAIDAGDPRPLAERFALAGEIAVVDLDAALGRGSNAPVIRELIKLAPCRVGGGIRDVQTALEWLDVGATKVVLGTAAVPEVLAQLPAERVVAALDAVDGEVVVEGWQRKTGKTIVERMQALRGLVGGFLVTFVEREGRQQGTRIDAVEQLIRAAAGAEVTIAGGITTPEEIATLDRLGANAQLGMAIYSGRLHLADAIGAPLVSDRPDGLFPTVVVDERGVALGLAYSSRESLRKAVDERRGVYHSRSRGLWVKGKTSGAKQELKRITLDCDCDTLRFVVRQQPPGFCHQGSATCWGAERGLGRLEATLRDRLQDAPPGSYTRRLFDDASLLQSKLREEASELAEATTRDELVWEAADLMYFTLARLSREDVPLSEVEAELDRRALRIRRRGGENKEKPSGD